MSNLNGRITKLEERHQPERAIVAVGPDMIWDVTNSCELAEVPAGAMVIAEMNAPIRPLAAGADEDGLTVLRLAHDR